MPSPTWIAELRVVLVHPNGKRVPGHIAVGQPYALAGADPTANYESHCPVEITGLHAAKHPIIGGGTLDALLNGVKFLGMRLHAFIERGGRVLYADEDADADGDIDVPLAAIFGPMMRATDPPSAD